MHIHRGKSPVRRLERTICYHQRKLTRNANGGNTSPKGYPWKATFRNRILGLNIQVRIGVKRDPWNTTGIAKFDDIIIRIFSELVPCNATSITREKTTLNGIR